MSHQLLELHGQLCELRVHAQHHQLPLQQLHGAAARTLCRRGKHLAAGRLWGVGRGRSAGARRGHRGQRLRPLLLQPRALNGELAMRHAELGEAGAQLLQRHGARGARGQGRGRGGRGGGDAGLRLRALLVQLLRDLEQLLLEVGGLLGGLQGACAGLVPAREGGGGLGSGVEEKLEKTEHFWQETDEA